MSDQAISDVATAIEGETSFADRGARKERRLGRTVRRAVHGVLLLDKPLDFSSNDALQVAKRLFRAEKAGHTGTLDPLATGLLPLCFGAATKFSQISLDSDKRYVATLRLGQTTTTGDGEGDLLDERTVDTDMARIEAACRAHIGEIDQVPPMHSALKHDGKALYEYARAGVEVERTARRITIHHIDIVQWNDVELVIDVQCSKGTYIRTLAETIGSMLGCGAHLSALRRVQCGQLTLPGATTLDALEDMSEEQRDALLLPVDSLLGEWPVVRLGTEDAGRFLSGVRRRTSLPDMAQARVYGPQEKAFLGSGHVKAGELISTRLLSPLEVEGLCAIPANNSK